MKIAYYSDSTAIGGAEIVVRDLIGALDRSFDVAVIGVDAAVVSELAKSRDDTERIVIRPVRGRADLTGMRAYRRLLKNLRADVLHVQCSHLGAAQWVMVVGATVPGLRVVATEHSLINPGSRAGRTLKRFTARLLDAHVAVGHRSAREVERMIGLRPGSVIAIHNGVHEHPPVPHHGHAGELQLGWIGRFDSAKGLDVLLDAVALVPEANVLLVGDGAERAAVEEQSARLGLQHRVSIRPWSDDARAELDAADVFVLPSRMESFPLTVLEAMMVALPVVATDVGSVSEAVITGVTGLLVPPNDPRALASAFRKLLHEPDLRALMGYEGRAVALAWFDVSTMTAKYEDLYRDVTRRRARRPTSRATASTLRAMTAASTR
jgi:glycosyltransferase involved in cell wall biosynthesis